jgi:cell division protease FtsH
MFNSITNGFEITKIPEINYNSIIQDLSNHKISKIYIDPTYKELISYGDSTQYYHTQVNPIVVPNLVEKATNLNIPIEFKDFHPDNLALIKNLFLTLFNFGTYAIVGIFILSTISSIIQFSNMNKINSNPSSNTRNKNIFSNLSPFQQKNENKFFKPNVSLESWAGSPEVIEECTEVISYIQNKELFETIGADMPKGILFEGPPGTGKTLLAKAIASNSNSSFISISASEFVELFVGMGAAKVRDLFNSARENKPSIIFIDEIDAVGRQRGSGINMANDEREQTLNQLLYEMDGFNNNTDVIVLAATNRKDVLDQALLRPGRFDRIIRIPLPDQESRQKILEYYLNNKYLNSIALNTTIIAELTEGFSGAELKNLLNEAAISSAKNNQTQIQEKYIFQAFEKSMVGLIKNNVTIPEITQQRVAIHEAGHSLLSLIYSNYFDFKKASIKPTYNGAGGYTIFSEKQEIKSSGLYTKDILKKRLVVALGGKAAEYLYYGDQFVSLGANEDLRQANKLAKRMIGNFGMGDKLEVFFNEDIGDESNPFLGRSLGTPSKYSEYTKYIMDKESLNLVNEAYKEAKDILKKNYDLLLQFSDSLKENIVLTKDDSIPRQILNGTQIVYLL